MRFSITQKSLGICLAIFLPGVVTELALQRMKQVSKPLKATPSGIQVQSDIAAANQAIKEIENKLKAQIKRIPVGNARDPQKKVPPKKEDAASAKSTRDEKPKISRSDNAPETKQLDSVVNELRKLSFSGVAIKFAEFGSLVNVLKSEEERRRRLESLLTKAQVFLGGLYLMCLIGAIHVHRALTLHQQARDDLEKVDKQTAKLGHGEPSSNETRQDLKNSTNQLSVSQETPGENLLARNVTDSITMEATMPIDGNETDETTPGDNTSKEQIATPATQASSANASNEKLRQRKIKVETPVPLKDESNQPDAEKEQLNREIERSGENDKLNSQISEVVEKTVQEAVERAFQGVERTVQGVVERTVREVVEAQRTQTGPGDNVAKTDAAPIPVEPGHLDIDGLITLAQQQEEDGRSEDRAALEGYLSEAKIWNQQGESLKARLKPALEACQGVLDDSTKARETLPPELREKLQGRQQGLELILKMLSRLPEKVPDFVQPVTPAPPIAIGGAAWREILREVSSEEEARKRINDKLGKQGMERYQTVVENRGHAEKNRKGFLSFVERQLLPILDGIDDGERHSASMVEQLKVANRDASGSLDNWFQTYAKLRNELTLMLDQVKVSVMKVEPGVPIDYERHEPFEIEPDEKLLNEQVKSVVRNGYEYEATDEGVRRILRPAQVVVVKNAE